MRSMVAKDPSFSHMGNEDLGAQADLSLRWAQMPLYWSCHEVAQIDLSFNLNCLENYSSTREGFNYHLMAYEFRALMTSQKHTCIILTPSNPTFI